MRNLKERRKICMKIYDYLGVNDADFVNIELEKNIDVKYYIDPFSLILKDQKRTNFSQIALKKLHTFFQKIADNLLNRESLTEVVNHIGEVKYTKLGWSEGGHGKGSAVVLSDLLINELHNSDALKTGLVSDIADMSIFINGVGKDRISDMITNIIIDLLSVYTKDQLGKFEKVKFQSVSCYYWNEEKSGWGKRSIEVAVIEGMQILVVPKRYVVSLESNDFGYYQFIYRGFLAALRKNYLMYVPELGETYKSGKKKGEVKPPSKKAIKEKLELDKISKFEYVAILDIALKYPGILEKAKDEFRDYVKVKLNK